MFNRAEVKTLTQTALRSDTIPQALEKKDDDITLIAAALFQAIKNYQLINSMFTSVQTEKNRKQYRSWNKQEKSFAREQARNDIKSKLDACTPSQLSALFKSIGPQNNTLFQAAILTKDLKLVRVFVAYCFNATTFSEWIFDAIDKYCLANNHQKLMIRSEIISVLKDCNPEQLMEFSDLTNLGAGSTPLQYACERGDMELVTAITEALWYDENDLACCNGNGENLLHSIIWNRHQPQNQELIFTKVLALLKENGKDKLLLQQQDNWGKTPAELATSFNNPRLVALMPPAETKEEKVATYFPKNAEKFRELHEFFTQEKKLAPLMTKLYRFIGFMGRIKKAPSFFSRLSLCRMSPTKNNPEISSAPTTHFQILLNKLIAAKPSPAELGHYLNFLEQQVKPTEAQPYAERILHELRPKNTPAAGLKY